jgi:hypothetical protein
MRASLPFMYMYARAHTHTHTQTNIMYHPTDTPLSPHTQMHTKIRYLPTDTSPPSIMYTYIHIYIYIYIYIYTHIMYLPKDAPPPLWARSKADSCTVACCMPSPRQHQPQIRAQIPIFAAVRDLSFPFLSSSSPVPSLLPSSRPFPFQSAPKRLAYASAQRPVCMYVCMYVCMCKMYVCMYLCNNNTMYVCMYVCTYDSYVL